jgi:hypothetical protein
VVFERFLAHRTREHAPIYYKYVVLMFSRLSVDSEIIFEMDVLKNEIEIFSSLGDYDHGLQLSESEE